MNNFINTAPGLIGTSGGLQDKRGQSYNSPSAVWLNTFEELFNHVINELQKAAKLDPNTLKIELNKLKGKIKTLIIRYFNPTLLELNMRVELQNEVRSYKKKIEEYNTKLQLAQVPESNIKISPFKKSYADIVLDYIPLLNKEIDPIIAKIHSVNAQNVSFM